VTPRLASTAPDAGTVLAFDFGTRRIGVAVGDLTTGLAHPLTVVHGEGSDARFAAIAALVSEWRPSQLLVGVPVHADGAEHAMTQRARRFARQLEGRFGVPVTGIDERYTTRAAAEALSNAGVSPRAQRAVRDATAAQIMLQTWLDARHE
jgi:putative Holliday junction resolvase